MDFVNRFSGRTQSFNVDNLLKFADLSPTVKRHLSKVYTTLTAAVLVSALGVVANLVTGIGGWLSIIGFVVCASWLAATPAMRHNTNKRYGLLAGAAFSQGLSLGPLVGAALDVEAGMVLLALLATTAVFASFSGAAMLAKRRSWLYLGGTLSSAISVFALMRLGSWVFGHRAALFQVELYGGLLVFLGYVLFDTQMIIERAYAGELDHIKHAMDLFVDFAAIFVRILVIMLKNAEKKEQRRRKRSD